MKLFIIRKVALLAALLTAGSALANTQFTMGENDTLRISPAYLGQAFQTTVRAHLDARFDTWNLTITYPEGIHALAASPGSGMTVHYLGSQGNELSSDIPLVYNAECTAFLASSVNLTGYCDFWGTGSFISYGTVKWETGDYDDMFSIVLYVDEDFEYGDLIINGKMSAQADPRDSGGSGRAIVLFKRIAVVVEALKGDVNADGQVNITDATMLIGYLINGSGEIDYDAADLTGDGQVNISDATMLINHLSTQP